RIIAFSSSICVFTAAICASVLFARMPDSIDSTNCSASASRIITRMMRFGPLPSIAACAVVALAGRYRPATYTLKMKRVRRARPLSCSSWPSTWMRSSRFTPSSSAARTGKCGVRANRKGINLETVFHPRRAKRGACAARRVALHVHRHRVHRDVGRRGLDVHRERGRVAAQALWPDAEQIDRLAERGFELRAFRIFAARAERPRGRDLGQVHAQVGGAAYAHADDGRRTGLAARFQHAVDDEGLDRVDALGRNRHAQPGVVLRARALGDHFDHQGFLLGEIDIDHRHAAPGGVLLVDARGRMHDRGAERVLPGRARAAAPDRVLEAGTIDLHAATDPHVVDRDAGVLAEQVVRVLGDRDVADHGAEHALRPGIGLRRGQALEAVLDIRRQLLQRADVELLGGLLDLGQIDFHFTSMWRSLTTRAQSALSAFISRAISSGVLPTGARPCTYSRPRRSLASSAFLVSTYTLCSTLFGVPVGATRPNQPVFSKPGMVLAIGGTPGSCAASPLLVTPSARSRPPWMWPSAAATLPMKKLVSPATEAASPGPSPL